MNARSIPSMQERLERKLAACREALRTEAEARRDVESRLEAERGHGAWFAHNPLPMMVFDLETLRFLDVNQAAIEAYG